MAKPKAKLGKAAPKAGAHSTAVTTAAKQQKPVIGRPFQPGQSGNPKGRPRSSKHKLSECFVQMLVRKFEEKGEAAIDEVIKDKPAEFLRVIATVIPKQLEAEDDEGNVYGVAVITAQSIAAIIERGRN